MRQSCRSRIADLIKRIKETKDNQKCKEAIFIVDAITGPILSSSFNDFFALGVKNITKIQLKKKPEPKTIGIYFLSSQSLPLIIQDFKDEPKYHSINVLVCQEITTEAMKSFAGEKKVMQRLVYFGQLHLHVKYLSQNCGLICEENGIFTSLMRNQMKSVPESIVNRLFEAIVCGYGDNFILKIFHSNSVFYQNLVKSLMVKYQEFKTANNQKENSEEEGKQINLLLVDRRMDLISPLVRNFYYSTLISDIYQVDYFQKEVTLKEGKKIKIDFENNIFQQYKNLHISKAQTLLQPDFKKFKTQNKAAQLKSQKNLANLQLKHIIRDLPKYNKQVASYEDNIDILHEISTLSKQQNLPQIGEIEQLIVSGFSGHGEELKDKRILQRAIELCNRLLDSDKKVRILVLLLLCVECSQKEKKSFINQIKQIQKYNKLGLLLQNQLNNFCPRPMKLALVRKQKVFLDLHQSMVYVILNQLIQKGISKAVGLTIIGQQKKKASKFESMLKKQQKQWLVFILGGISMNQICQLQRLQTQFQGNKINMISTELFSTWNYLSQLSNLAK